MALKRVRAEYGRVVLYAPGLDQSPAQHACEREAARLSFELNPF